MAGKNKKNNVSKRWMNSLGYVVTDLNRSLEDYLWALKTVKKHSDENDQ